MYSPPAVTNKPDAVRAKNSDDNGLQSELEDELDDDFGEMERRHSRQSNDTTDDPAGPSSDHQGSFSAPFEIDSEEDIEILSDSDDSESEEPTRLEHSVVVSQESHDGDVDQDRDYRDIGELEHESDTSPDGVTAVFPEDDSHPDSNAYTSADGASKNGATIDQSKNPLQDAVTVNSETSVEEVDQSTPEITEEASPNGSVKDADLDDGIASEKAKMEPKKKNDASQDSDAKESNDIESVNSSTSFDAVPIVIRVVGSDFLLSPFTPPLTPADSEKKFDYPDMLHLVALFEDDQIHECTVEQLFERLRQQEELKELQLFDDAREMRLDFPQLHMYITEDNIYCREVTIRDFIQTFQNLCRNSSNIARPMSLDMVVSTQLRFITQFNMLAQSTREGLGFDLVAKRAMEISDDFHSSKRRKF